MAADLCPHGKTVELHELPAEDVPHELVAERADFAFTSPPYFSKEHYGDDDTQSWQRYSTGDEWRDGFLAAMLALQFAALRSDRWAAVNIADVTIRGKRYPLHDWTVDVARAAGFEYVRTERFPLPRVPGTGADARDERFEPVIVLHKS
jgi:DNA modification methylase